MLTSAAGSRNAQLSKPPEELPPLWSASGYYWSGASGSDFANDIDPHSVGSINGTTGAIEASILARAGIVPVSTNQKRTYLACAVAARYLTLVG